MPKLALDLGTTTGWALSPKRGTVVSGTWSLKPLKGEGPGMRFVRFDENLRDAWIMKGVDAVYYENVRRHIGTQAAHVYGGLKGILQMRCAQRGIPCLPAEVGAIKKFWTGKGNAKKDAMIAEARRRGFTPVDDNEADAIAILHMMLMEG